MKFTKYVLGWLLMGLIISSCGENEPREVNVMLQLNVGQEALIHGNTYTVNGINVQFTNVAYYLGDMKFETSNGTSYESTDRYHLIKPGGFNFNFTIPADVEAESIDLSKITFFVGVDAITNAEAEIDFTERATGDPLGQQNPTMHWGWAGGYRFLNIDGLADIDGDGMFETQLTYHLGKNDFLKNITLNPNQKLEEGKNDFGISFDMGAFLSGLDFETENFTKVQPDNLSIADKLLNNYDSAFIFTN